MNYIYASKALTVALLCLSMACAQPGEKDGQLHQPVVLFDGETLTGWQAVDPADAHYWSVIDSLLTGGDGMSNVPKNTYLQTIKEYGDFEFRCLFRLSGDQTTGFINSGIQYRSHVVNDDMVGYQADIGDGHWGDIYDEHRRALLVAGDLRTLQHFINKGGWNSYIVRVRGNHHELYINGVKTCDYIETDPDIPSKGVIAIQLHSGGAAKIQLRDVTITEF
ncbi:DUF1080 domain-containing protein [Parapedobacter sp. 2B3]|uniref:3-keto-disaccharide hydrolase n=1 Tax=Parapedobacter sp. 2B3 TaxID=3342381 RepID=UPI0035B67A21